MWGRGAFTIKGCGPQTGGVLKVLGVVKTSLSATQPPIRQKEPNFIISYFRPSKCRPLHNAARGACPLRRRSRRHWVLGVVILTVRLSHAWIVTKLNEALQIFLYHTKGQSLCYSETNSGLWATPPSSEIRAQSDPPPSKNADFDRFPLITSQP